MAVRPAVVLTLAFALGIVAACYCRPSLPVAAVALAVSFLLIRIMPCSIAGLAPFTVVCAGFFYMTAWLTMAGHSALEPFRGCYVTVRGTVLRCENKSDSWSAKLRVSLVIYKGRQFEPPGRSLVLLSMKARTGKVPRLGDAVEVQAMMEAFRSSLNPGCYRYEEAAMAEGILERLTVRVPGSFRIMGKGDLSPLLSLSSRLKDRMQGVIRKNHGPVDALVMSGIVFGDKSELPDPVLRAFRDTGTFHLLAASGMNIAILVGAVVFLFSLFGMEKKRSLVFSLPVIIVYALMAGASASIVRASLMATLAIIALQADRESDPLNTLFSAAFIMLVINPHMIFDIGFQLSLGAVLALLAVSSPAGKVSARVPPCIRTPIELFLMSSGVQLYLAPVIAYHFFSFSLLSPFCNVFAVPPAGLLLYGGLLEAAAGMLWEPLSLPFALFNDFLLFFLMAVISAAGSIPFCALPAGRPDSLWLVSYYGLLCIFTWWLHHGFQSRSRTLLVAALVLVLLLPASRLLTFCTEKPLKVVFLDVGEGDAIYLALPGGEHLLIDGGPCSRSGPGGRDAGERVLLPFLRAARVPLLDLVILTHSHDDHFGGLNSLALEGLMACFIEGPSLPMDRNYLELKKTVGKRSIMSRRVYGGAALGFRSGVSMKVLAPLRYCCHTGNGDTANFESLVLRLSYRGRHILFMGDCDMRGEEELIRSGALLSADLVKIGHHGSAGSTSAELLDRVKPRYAVMSVGRYNRHGHPSPQVLHSLHERGIRVYRTDENGAVTCTIDSRSMKVRPLRESWKKEPR